MERADTRVHSSLQSPLTSYFLTHLPPAGFYSIRLAHQSVLLSDPTTSKRAENEIWEDINTHTHTEFDPLGSGIHTGSVWTERPDHRFLCCSLHICKLWFSLLVFLKLEIPQQNHGAALSNQRKRESEVQPKEPLIRNSVKAGSGFTHSCCSLSFYLPSLSASFFHRLQILTPETPQ